MAKTVVGLFKNMIEAQNVKHDLVSEGYSSDSIRVVANDEKSTLSTGSAVGTRNEASQGTGVMSSVKNFFKSFTEADDTDHNYYSEGVNRGGAMLAVTVPEERAGAVQAFLEQRGASDVDEQFAGQATTASPKQTSAANATGEVAIPIVEEELLVGKRQVNRGGVRVYSHVVETPVEENVQLREEHVRVQRNTVDRPASEADFQASKEGTIELTETGEEAVVSKQARVVEEVTVGKDVSERSQKVSDTVRRTEVEVENLTTDKAKRTNAGSK
ncbi:MAG: DUF2382 domain-containing protein [Acidobacteriota bacterium]|nr:DUF2382 domain-containing protein [Acidobacteriota bacterium]